VKKLWIVLAHIILAAFCIASAVVTVYSIIVKTQGIPLSAWMMGLGVVTVIGCGLAVVAVCFHTVMKYWHDG